MKMKIKSFECSSWQNFSDANEKKMNYSQQFLTFSIQEYQCSFVVKMITELKASTVHLETIFFIVRSNQKTKETKHGKI